MDNGPEVSSRRTQFIKRIVECSDKIEKPIELVYYPPYHSQYNPMEHCWGGIAPHVYFLDHEYHRGVKLG